MGAAQQAWADQLAAWAIDADILAAAPESPYGFPPGLFGLQRGAVTTHRAISSALPEHGSLLDVGCGGGSASIPVAPVAGRLLGVDASAEMIAAFTTAAADTGADVRTWTGPWTEVAADVPAADVVVAAHLVYNVAEIGSLLTSLTAHARRRVVIELTDTHPWTGMAALWRHFHGQERPAGPSIADFLAVTNELGIDVAVESFDRESVWASAPPDVVLAFNRRRLCLPVEREAEVAAAMRELAPSPTTTTSTVWWDV